MAQNGEESQLMTSLQAQVAELQTELEAACSRENDLAAKLQTYEAAAQDAMNPETIAYELDAMHQARDDSSDTATELKIELEKLAFELSASEERCRQLETALAMAADAEAGSSISPDSLDAQQNRLSPGRAYFIEQLDVLLSRQDQSEEDHSLMYVLLDNFTRIRDEIGVVESESVVSDVSRIIEADCNPGDLMARFGDCTFAVLCTNTTADEAEERAGRIRAVVESRIFEYSGRSLVTTTSIGICSLRRNDNNPEKIISRVDLACDAARLSGGNRVIVSSAIADEINISGNDDQHREMVQSTISENRIMIYYQPISSLRGQPGNHFEVLVRLVDKSGDMILPGEFFAMAEGVGCANEVDRFIIDKALQEISGHNDGMTKYYIKLTRQSVADNDLPDWIMSRIDEYGVKPEQLVFEIAESVLKSDLRNLASLSSALHALDCKIAIEHYRMSTNLQHLMHVHTDYLKIDRELVGNVEKRGESLAKVAAIIDLATKNNYITIAEGVESPECLAMIWELGISMAQGYFVQVPAASREYVDQDIITGGKEEADSKAIFDIS
jgi:diguanylate cyclase (GGDEF)-like protein